MTVGRGIAAMKGRAHLHSVFGHLEDLATLSDGDSFLVRGGWAVEMWDQLGREMTGLAKRYAVLFEERAGFDPLTTPTREELELQEEMAARIEAHGVRPPKKVPDHPQE